MYLDKTKTKELIDQKYGNTKNLAGQCGIEYTKFCKIVKGEREADKQTSVLIAMMLGVKPEEIERKPVVDLGDRPLGTDKTIYDGFESLRKEIEELRGEIQGLSTTIRQLNSVKKQESDFDRAMDLFGTYLNDGKGYCYVDVVYAEADEKGIPRQSMQDAREKLGLITSFRGYGKNSRGILMQKERTGNV